MYANLFMSYLTWYASVVVMVVSSKEAIIHCSVFNFLIIILTAFGLAINHQITTLVRWFDVVKLNNRLWPLSYRRLYTSLSVDCCKVCRSQSRGVIGFEKLLNCSFSFPAHPLHNYSLPSVSNLPHRPSPSTHTYDTWHSLPHIMLLSVILNRLFLFY